MKRESIQELLASVVSLRARAISLSECLQDRRMIHRDLMTKRREIIEYRKDTVQRLLEIHEQIVG